MKKIVLAGVVLALVTALVLVGIRRESREKDELTDTTLRSAPLPPDPNRAEAAPTVPLGFLYGRATTVGGATYEGRLRWGGNQEAFWGDFFNGVKATNPWAAHVPVTRLPREQRSFELLGIEIAKRARVLDLHRPFVARFGDLARIEAHGREVRVTLKSGTIYELDRLEASDFDDGLRVWDERQGVVDLDSLRIRSVELLADPQPYAAPRRLWGTVRTRHGTFSGFVQWNRNEGVGSDELDGESSGKTLRLPFDRLRAIARRSSDSALVTLLDGSEIVLSASGDVGQGNRGVYVDDARYGKVLVSRDAFERLDFSPVGEDDSGPAYTDFPPGQPLSGSVTTSGGVRLTGRIVCDLDESETTDTLDAPAQGVDYALPFGTIAAILRPAPAAPEPHTVQVTLHNGETLHLEPSGDLGGGHLGILVFPTGREQPEYFPWAEVTRVDFDEPHP